MKPVQFCGLNLFGCRRTRIGVCVKTPGKYLAVARLGLRGCVISSGDKSYLPMHCRRWTNSLGVPVQSRNPQNRRLTESVLRNQRQTEMRPCAGYWKILRFRHRPPGHHLRLRTGFIVRVGVICWRDPQAAAIIAKAMPETSFREILLFVMRHNLSCT